MITVDHDQETDSEMDRFTMAVENFIDGVFHGLRYLFYLVLALAGVACVVVFALSMMR